MGSALADYLHETQAAQIERLEQTYATQVIPVAREGYRREIVTSDGEETGR
jgi:hypothetical protein